MVHRSPTYKPHSDLDEKQRDEKTHEKVLEHSCRPRLAQQLRDPDVRRLQHRIGTVGMLGEQRMSDRDVD